MGKRGENIYKRKDGRWEGRYSKGRKSNGRIKYGYIYGMTYQEVRQKLYAAKAKYQSICSLRGQSAISLNQWAEMWLASIQNNVKLSTYSSYRYKLQRYVLNEIGDYPLNLIEKEMIQKLTTVWSISGLKPNTIHVIFRILSNCLNEAVKLEHLENNPCQQVLLPKKDRKQIQALRIEEQKKLEEIALKKEHDHGLAIILALHTGMRIGELSALKWESIDFQNNLIQITHTYQRIFIGEENRKSQLSYDRTKTVSSERIIPISHELKRLLKKKYLKARGIFVFECNDKPCEPRLLTYHFHRIRSAAGLENIHFHQLRHTFATRCLEAGADIVSVSAMLGHSSTQMTLDRYSHSLMEQRILAIKTMEKSVAFSLESTNKH